MATHAQRVVGAATDSDPDSTTVARFGDRLKQVAENLRAVAPKVIEIAAMIGEARTGCA